MQHVVTPDPINSYAEKFSTDETENLKALNEVTHENVRGAHMISGHLQGMFLELICRMVKPKQVLEIGTFTGYSAICLALGLEENAVVHTIDTDASLSEIRKKHYEGEGVAHKIIQHIGDAKAVIETLDGPFELVFIDADKKSYWDYFNLVLPKMPSGGFILADNVLFRGEVILPEDQQSKTAQFMHEFNKKVAEDNRVEQMILPLRDGISIIRKR